MLILGPLFARAVHISPAKIGWREVHFLSRTNFRVIDSICRDGTDTPEIYIVNTALFICRVSNCSIYRLVHVLCDFFMPLIIYKVKQVECVFDSKFNMF